MTNLLPTLLPILEAHTLPGIPAGQNTVFPFYHRHSLASLPASVCHWLDVPTFGCAPLTPEILNAAGGPFRRVILMVVDGLGLEQFQQILNLGSQAPSTFSVWHTLLNMGFLAPLTSVVPSSTSTALTTLWTGSTPAEHGVMGYEMYLKEYGMIANTITHAPASFIGEVNSLRRAGFHPESFLPTATLGPHLTTHGVEVNAFQHVSIARSGLSSMLFPQVNVLPFRTLSDLWVSVPSFLESTPHHPSYTYIYWGDLDDLMHRFNPQDQRVNLEFSNFTVLFDYFTAQLRKSSHSDTLLLLTADHGHLHTPHNPIYDLKTHPQLASCLHMSPCGENRLAYFYLRPGREEQARQYLEHTWPGKFNILPSAQAIASGLFGSGSLHPRLEERLGDWVVVAKDSAYLWWADKENMLRGRHGGLSRTEMLIPLLGVVF